MTGSIAARVRKAIDYACALATVRELLASRRISKRDRAQAERLLARLEATHAAKEG